MAETDQQLEAELATARAEASLFLQSAPRDDRLVVFCHCDADGLAAGALFGRILPVLGFEDVLVVPSLRGESAFSGGARARIAELQPARLIVTDLSIRDEPVVPGIPTMYVDHHRPDGLPPEGVVISSYTWDPIPNSAWLAYELLEPLARIDDVAWIAAIGTIGDLGERAPWHRLPDLRKRFTARWLKEAVALVNAARRASAYDVATPLRMLLEADHPREISENVDLGADLLKAYREEVNAELREARKQAPVFSADQPFALIRMHSPCQIHPLIAQQWRTRLPKFAVMAANTGYLPDVVAFSMRTQREDLILPKILQALELGDTEGRFGQGHDRASGGHLPVPLFNELLHRFGFPESVRGGEVG